MANSEKAAAKIIEGFRQSNGNFHRDQLGDENTLKNHGKLSGRDKDRANVIDRAISQLIAAVGSDIEHAVIVNAPKGAPGNDNLYHCAVFSRELLGYIEFMTSGPDPQILVRTIPRNSITEIEVRAAKDYRADNGRLVFVVKYASGIRLDIRERDADGQDVGEPRPWIRELLDGLREDLAAA